MKRRNGTAVVVGIVAVIVVALGFGILNADRGPVQSADAEEVTPSPVLSTVNPNYGPSAGGTLITLTGSNFVTGARVLVNNQPATDVTVVSPTQITAVTPMGGFGISPVTIYNPDGQGTQDDSGFDYQGPTVAVNSPATAQPNDPVTVTATATGIDVQQYPAVAQLLVYLDVQGVPPQLIGQQDVDTRKTNSVTVTATWTPAPDIVGFTVGVRGVLANPDDDEIPYYEGNASVTIEGTPSPTASPSPTS